MKKYNKITLLAILAVLLCISLGSVSAADTGNNSTNNTTIANFTNPGFESGNLTGWIAGSKTNITNRTSHSGQYGAHFSAVSNQSSDNLTQTVNLTNVKNVTFWGYGEGTAGTTYAFYVYIDNNLIESFIPTSNAWTQYTVSTSGYTGLHDLTITWYGQCMYSADVDDFSINAPTANFTTIITSGTSPLTVQFNDTSTDNPTSWLWNFGDGTTSTEQNPIHTYTTPGIYTVKLTATNEADHNKVSDNGQITKTNYITVTDATKPLIFISTPQGAYNTTQNITLTTIDPYGLTTTYYTTDGSDPQNSTTRNTYNEPITINTTTTLRYIAINSKNIWSPEYTQNYTLDFIAPSAVNNSLAGGTYNTTQKVTLTATDSNSDFTICYTNDTTDPRTSTTRTIYTEPITIDKTTTLRYAAVDPSGNWSPLSIQNYVIGTEGVYTPRSFAGPVTNTTNWTYTFGIAPSSITTGPDGTIYIGVWQADSGYISSSGYLYAFNPNGTLKWKFHTGAGNIIIGSDGTIYIGGGINELYTFYALTDNGNNCTVKWNYTTGFDCYINGYTIGPDGIIYVYACNSGGGLLAFYPNGTLKSKNLNHDYITNLSEIALSGTPVIGTDGTMYMAGSNYILSESNGVTLIMGTQFNLYAINPDGTVQWTYPIGSGPGDGIDSLYLSSDGTIYAKTDGALYAIYQNGTLKWNYTAPANIGGFTVGSDGNVYFSTGDGWTTADRGLYALNPDGTLKWKYEGDTRAYVISGPTIGPDGSIYFLSYYKTFYALNPDNGTVKWSYNNCTSYTFDANGTIYLANNNSIYASNPDGTLKWNYTNNKSISYYTLNNGTLYISCSDGKLYTIKDPVPTANFKTNTTNANTSQSIQFTDNSTGSPTSWLWNFGDGNTSNLQNPNHTYTTPGIYTVTLTVTGPGGSDEEIKTSYITINTPDTTKPTASASVKTGTYNTNKTIKLTMNENGTIYYTLNGSTPTTSSKKYTGAITISSTTTLKYIAVDTAGNKSPIYTQTYTIDKTAPKVTATNPKNKDTGVSRTSIISIKLSENVVKSANWSKIYIKNLKTGQKCKITAWVSGNHIYIKTSKKAALTWYQIYIPKSAIKDKAGNNLAAIYTWKFKTVKT